MKNFLFEMLKLLLEVSLRYLMVSATQCDSDYSVLTKEFFLTTYEISADLFNTFLLSSANESQRTEKSNYLFFEKRNVG